MAWNMTSNYSVTMLLHLPDKISFSTHGKLALEQGLARHGLLSDILSSRRFAVITHCKSRLYTNLFALSSLNGCNDLE